MRPYSEIRFSPFSNPSKEVAAEMLRRHHDEPHPSVLKWISSVLAKLWRATPQKPEPPQWPLAGVRQPLGGRSAPRSGAVVLKEPWI